MNKILIGVIFIAVLAFSWGSVSLYSTYKEAQQSFGLAVLTVPQGGTGAATFPVGDCIKGNGTSALTSGVCGSASAGIDSWTHVTVYGKSPVSATSTFMAFSGGLAASSTSFFVNASTTNLTIFSTFYISSILGKPLATDATTGQVYGAATTTAANPSASVTLSVQNGTAATYMRSDASPALDQTISPTMTGAWAFNNAATTTIAKGFYAGLIAAPYFIASSTAATSSLPAITFNVFSWAGGVFSSFSSAFTSSTGVLTLVSEPGFFISTSTAWTGTTTFPIRQVNFSETLSSVRCKTDQGTLNVQFGIGSASTTMLNASTTNNSNSFTANNTLSAGNQLYVSIGTPASSPTYINCTPVIKI